MFDYDTYLQNRDFYIDYLNIIPGPACHNVDELIETINKLDYNEKRIEKFSDLMIKKTNKSYTDDFVDFLLDRLKNS